MIKANFIHLLTYVLIVPLGLYTLSLLFLFLFQSSLIYFPGKAMIGTPHDLGLAYDAVDFKASDGIELSGWFVPGRSDQVVLFCHGNAGNISDRLDSLQVFNRLGLNVFIFDYRGYGESKGKATEAGTYRDAEAAWAYLVQQKSYSPGQIIIFGRSLGGAVAAHLAMNKKPAALIVESTFPSLPDLGQRLYRFFPVRLLSRFNYSTADCLRRVTCPVLVVHSLEDEIVPFDLGLQVYEAAREPKELLEIRGDHNGGFITSGDVYVDGLRSFLDKYASP